ncbi:MAG: hypothetical protein L3J73_01945 [Thermoplasmata archaeon]|nr:hypothetical protein [Thermoplasmata archaeon]
MRSMVIYDSWYGDTRRVAEEIARAIAQTTGVDAALVEVDRAGIGRVHDYDLLVLGTPNHFGGPTRKIRQLVRDLEDLGPFPGKIALFDTCYAADVGKATGKLVDLLRTVRPPGGAAPARLSVIVEATRGPVRPGELARAHAFGVEVAQSVPIARIVVPA